MACLRREGWMEVTMISHVVEISIAGGVAETQDEWYWVANFMKYRANSGVVREYGEMS